MGRGMGRLAERGRKCCCEKPRWEIFAFKVSEFGDKFTITPWCLNCGALWDTHSATSEVCGLLNDNQKKDVIDVLHNRRETMERNIEEYREIITETEGKIKRTEKRIEKIGKQIEELGG